MEPDENIQPISETRRATRIAGPAGPGDPLVEDGQRLDVVDGRVRREEEKAVTTCATCGLIFHDAVKAIATCIICGTALCEQDATIRCADPNCGGAICSHDRRQWGKAWYCRAHYGSNAAAVVAWFVIAVAVGWIVLKHIA